ncbi:MAG: NusG domain II-containing protein [Clostridia bacterium]|nr:NusG domain II-containing protein [Clostridia bacterium]
MSLKKVEQVKVDKGFRIWDLIIYGAIAVIVAVLFIVIFVTKDESPLTGVRVFVEGQTVFEYEFNGEPMYSETVKAEHVKEDDSGLTVTVNSSDGGVNVIYIDKSAKTVKVTEANCNGKQCVYFHAIDDNNKLIYCSPHGLRIEPLSRDYSDPNLTM